VSGLSLDQRRPTECVVSECDWGALIMRRPCPTRGCCAMEKNTNIFNPCMLFVYPHYITEEHEGYLTSLNLSLQK